MDKRPAKIKVSGTIKFFGGVLVVYIIGLLVNPQYFYAAFKGALTMFWKIIPVLFLVFSVLFVINILLERGKIKKLLSGARGIKGWLIVLLAGILIGGPPYVLYPLLHELKTNGLNNSFLAVFLLTVTSRFPLCRSRSIISDWNIP